jgi:hypothetical protein
MHGFRVKVSWIFVTPIDIFCHPLHLMYLQAGSGRNYKDFLENNIPDNLPDVLMIILQ